MNELIDTRHFMNIFQIISDSCVIKRERVARLKKKKKKAVVSQVLVYFGEKDDQ